MVTQHISGQVAAPSAVGYVSDGGHSGGHIRVVSEAQTPPQVQRHRRRPLEREPGFPLGAHRMAVLQTSSGGHRKGADH